jgi:hypothetical protein
LTLNFNFYRYQKQEAETERAAALKSSPTYEKSGGGSTNTVKTHSRQEGTEARGNLRKGCQVRFFLLLGSQTKTETSYIQKGSTTCRKEGTSGQYSTTVFDRPIPRGFEVYGEGTERVSCLFNSSTYDRQQIPPIDDWLDKVWEEEEVSFLGFRRPTRVYSVY